MVRVGAEDRAQVAQVVGGVEYRARDGYFEMPEPAAKLHLAAGNLPTPAAAGPVGRGSGYRCTNPECRFGTFIKTCGRCGAPCEREGQA